MLVRIFEFITAKGSIPTPFGGFHIMSLITVLAFSVFFLIKYKKTDEKTVRKMLLILSLIVIIFEIYKQLVYSLSYEGGRFIFKYDWHIFPFQFCSTPMFVGVVAAVIKNKKIHYVLCCYLATYGLLAGIIVLLTGSSLFSSVIGINIQTVVCHGEMVVLGVFLLCSGYVKTERKTVFYAFFPFVSGVGVAVVLNHLVYHGGLPSDQVFNMYFLSPYFPDDVPFIAFLRDFIPEILFVPLYILVFTAAIDLMLMVFRAANKK